MGILRSRARSPLRVRLREARYLAAVADHLWLMLAIWAVATAVGLLLWAVRRWRLTAPAGVVGWVWASYGTAAVLTGVTAIAATAAVAGAARPDLARRAWLRARAAWRRWAVYEREWEPVTVNTGLAELEPLLRVPALRRVRTNGDVDWLRVVMLPWHTVDQWEAATPRLRTAFAALDVRALSVPGSPTEVDLRVLARDPLREPLTLPPVPNAPDLAAIPVGRREDGEPLTLPLWRPGRGATHWLIAGETGAGKGSVLWSLTSGVAPLIGSGAVRLWGIDPKGGMELGAAAPLFTRLVWGEPSAEGEAWQEPMIGLLEEAVRGMQLRAARLRAAGERVHAPTPEDPLTVLIVDELAALTAYITDPALRRRAADALSLLLSQGRAPGVAVIAASQDVRKETVGMRDLFPGRIALRTAEPGMADMVLGKGARERGAQTDRIPPAMPGVGYVVLEDSPEPVRARFSYASDADLRHLSERYPAPPLGSPGRASRVPR